MDAAKLDPTQMETASLCVGLLTVLVRGGDTTDDDANAILNAIIDTAENPGVAVAIFAMVASAMLATVEKATGFDALEGMALKYAAHAAAADDK